MILFDTAIRQAVRAGDIVIDPFDSKQLGPNSYDLRLAPHLNVYALAPNDGIGRIFSYDGRPTEMPTYLDPQKPLLTHDVVIPEEGIILHPGILYLAHTVERAGSTKYVPMLEGRSSLARLGVSVHVTAGFGDVGFIGQWTLEITVTHPVRVCAGWRVCQVYFYEGRGSGRSRRPGKLYSGKYKNSNGVVPSRLQHDPEVCGT